MSPHSLPLATMQKSFIERVFPRPKQSILPQYDIESTYRDGIDTHEQSTLNLTRASTSPISHSSRQSSGNKSYSQFGAGLHNVPLSVSIIHHDDPFLEVDRAAANLEKTIQSLLDFQSQALSGRHSVSHDEALSQRSTTPTQASVNTSGNDVLTRSRPGVVPVRQPLEKRITLRGARQGLFKCMKEFAMLKEEETRIVRTEQTQRQLALDNVSSLEAKQEAVQKKITTLQNRANESQSQKLRSEARMVDAEIRELEGRLMELKARHRHLSERATQIENTAASELSSYRGTLDAIEKETRSFLRRPPVRQQLAPRKTSLDPWESSEVPDMYSMRSERRNLQMARSQWMNEIDVLATQTKDVEKEQMALNEGADMWRKVVFRIDEFERELRQKVKASNIRSTSSIVASLDSTMVFLHEKFRRAEAENWNLLVCAIGAELEAFKQARILIAPDEPFPNLEERIDAMPESTERTDDEDIPHIDLLGEHHAEQSLISNPKTFQQDSHSSVMESSSSHQPNTILSPNNSNESLRATLKDLRQEQSNMTSSITRNTSEYTNSRPLHVQGDRATSVYPESEDDEPGEDFFVSRD